MAERKFSEEHEWIEIDGDTATIGITIHAQEQLGDIVFVDLPEVGAVFNKDDEAGVVESVKAASEVYAPIGGERIRRLHRRLNLKRLGHSGPHLPKALQESLYDQ